MAPVEPAAPEPATGPEPAAAPEPASSATLPAGPSTLPEEPGTPPVGRPVPRPTSGAGSGLRAAPGARVSTGAGSRPPTGAGSRPSSGGAAGDRPSSGGGSGTDDRETERGLRSLVGSGSSQVSVGAALRARDAARPSEQQVAEAEEHLVIVRRNWAPREDLPRR